MKSSRDILPRIRSKSVFVTLALLSPVLLAAEPAKPAEESAGEASSKINDYRAEASDLNKAEAKAALKRLDADIDLLAAKIDAIPDPMRKKELSQRLKILKERRKELGSEFRKASYDALVDDVRAEWNQLTN